MAGFDITVQVGEHGVGTLGWAGSATPDLLSEAVSLSADDALIGRGLRRIEVALPAEDRVARRAVTRAGFRLEGTRRQVAIRPDGGFGDVCLYARLAADQVHGPHGFSGVMNSTLPKKRLIAHVLITDGADRILLCETRFKPDWELPGGVVEPGEPPRLGAAREVREELGIERAVGRLLVADWMPPYLGWDDAIELIFDGGMIDQSDLAGLVLQSSEIKRVQLCSLAEAAELVTPLSLRRLGVAAALGPAEMAYLEDGSRPG